MFITMIVFRKILDHLLSDKSCDDRIEQIFSILHDVAQNVRENQVPLSSLIITKQLSKNPNEYPDTKQAHVQVALRLNKEGGRMWKAGDTIPYIICDVRVCRFHYYLIYIYIYYFYKHY